MTDKQTAALTLALEALNGSQYRMNQYGYQAMETTIAANNKAITAIREALAEQPAQQQEPVAHIDMREWPPIRCREGLTRADLAPFDGQHLFLASQPAKQEIEELTAQRDKLADILTRTANALKGQPAELSAHSWHDLPEVAQQLKAAQQQEPVYHLKQFGDVTKKQLDRYIETGDINPQPAQQQEPVAKVVSTAPERIWLDLGFDPEVEDEISFDDLFEATWSHDNATGNGIEYVRADLAQRKPLTEEQWQEIAAITGCARIEKRGRDAILRVLQEAANAKGDA